MKLIPLLSMRREEEVSCAGEDGAGEVFVGGVGGAGGEGACACLVVGGGVIGGEGEFPEDSGGEMGMGVELILVGLEELKGG